MEENLVKMEWKTTDGTVYKKVVFAVVDLSSLGEIGIKKLDVRSVYSAIQPYIEEASWRKPFLLAEIFSGDFIPYNSELKRWIRENKINIDGYTFVREARELIGRFIYDKIVFPEVKVLEIVFRHCAVWYLFWE